MGGDVRVESGGIGHGTTFIIQMRSISYVSDLINDNINPEIDL